MPLYCDVTDVMPVRADGMAVPMRHLIGEGRGLALLNGLSDADFSALEDVVWREFQAPEERLAVALRFRALVAVFASRRLKSLLLERGYKVILAALAIAATERLNVDFGFRAQAFVMAIEHATRPTRTPAFDHVADLRTAA